jgi:ABC-2 type transport system permease protein
MNNIYPIFKKEVRTYFNSPIAYIFITLFLLLSGYFFGSTLFLQNQADLRSVFGFWVPFFLTLFVPAMTMRLIAEEKRSGTLEVLVTMPIKDSEVILGKYLAAFVLLLTAILLTFTYPLTISMLGNADGGSIVGGYLGLILMGASYLAIGVYISSLTENQIVAFIVSLAIIFILFMLDKILMLVPSGLVSILEYVSINYHFANIARGVIDSRDLIYYFSLMFLGLFLATRALASRKAA